MEKLFQMRKNICRKVFLVLVAILLCGCGRNMEDEIPSVQQPDINITEELPTNAPEITLPTNAPEISLPAQEIEQIVLPTSNDELYHYLMEQWKAGELLGLYSYASDEMKTLVDAEQFNSMFLTLNNTFGNIVKTENEKSAKDGGNSTYTATLIFEHVEAYIQVNISDLKIVGYNYDVRFVTDFENKLENGITESFFLLESGEYNLNAVYTDTENSNAPTVLLIPGSGVADYNETVGLLPTFADIAMELAERGINSLRFEKRTNRYASEFTVEAGLDEEYFIDCKAALEWIRNNNESGDIILFGHSLGAQIAVSLAEQENVKGLILFNGSARHLAEIAKDQYCEIDPVNAAYYQQYMDAAKAATQDTAKGYYYYGCSDYYWADYNELSTVDSLKRLGIQTLVINSRFDHQMYDEDINLWQTELADDKNVTIVVYDDISHFGYRIDTYDATSVYKKTEFPDDLAEIFAEFCEGIK